MGDYGAGQGLNDGDIVGMGMYSSGSGASLGLNVPQSVPSFSEPVLTQQQQYFYGQHQQHQQQQQQQQDITVGQGQNPGLYQLGKSQGGGGGGGGVGGGDFGGYAPHSSYGQRQFYKR